MTTLTVSTAGVVVSCKIPILATRVRFPGSATDFGAMVRSGVALDYVWLQTIESTSVVFPPDSNQTGSDGSHMHAVNMFQFFA